MKNTILIDSELGVINLQKHKSRNVNRRRLKRLKDKIRKEKDKRKGRK